MSDETGEDTNIDESAICSLARLIGDTDKARTRTRKLSSLMKAIDKAGPEGEVEVFKAACRPLPAQDSQASQRRRALRMRDHDCPLQATILNLPPSLHLERSRTGQRAQGRQMVLLPACGWSSQ